MAGERWLVTGGAGFIGAHVVRALLASGRRAVVVDDLSTGLVERIPPGVELARGTVLDGSFLTEVIRRTSPVGVIHLAGKKSPTESMSEPLLYARENAVGVISLMEAVRNTGLERMVFSSSCSVYGTPDVDPVGEDAPTLPESPYGESKLYGEQVLKASAVAYGLSLVSLRYFNVVGAATPELRDTGVYNLVPLAFRALREGRPCTVYGGDYPTPDGTCIRDYLDVEDLADAHVRAAELLEKQHRIATYNVGRGEGSSVFDVLDALSSVTGTPIPRTVVSRRSGDPARIVARADRIAQELGWSTQRTLVDMVGSAWKAELGWAARAGDSGAR